MNSDTRIAGECAEELATARSGDQSVQRAASDLPAGIYLVEIRAGAERATLKTILTK